MVEELGKKSSGSSDWLYWGLVRVGQIEDKTKLSPRFRGCMLWRIVLSLREIGKPRVGVNLGEKVMSFVLDILNLK